MIRELCLSCAILTTERNENETSCLRMTGDFVNYENFVTKCDKKIQLSNQDNSTVYSQTEYIYVYTYI